MLPVHWLIALSSVSLGPSAAAAADATQAAPSSEDASASPASEMAPPAPSPSLPALTPPPDMDAPAKLRNGIVLGLVWGPVALGRGTGYPNNSQQIGDSRYYADSGLLLGGGEALLVLGALADYLNAGFWLQLGAFTSKHQRMGDVGLGLRVEAFPFVRAQPKLQGLGAFANFGLGVASLVDPSTKDVRAQGTQSFIGAGILYEIPFGHVFGGHFAIGPTLEYDSVFSRPFTESGVQGSVRFAFYGGP